MIAFAALLSLALLTIAAIHAYWGLGGVWPEKSAAELARAVVGDGRSRMPPPGACFAVAALLAIVGAWPWLIVARAGSDLVLAGGLAISAVFFLRGLAGYSPRWRARHAVEPFASRDRSLYSPLCLMLATGFLALLSQEM
jgi:hypothetical protein